MFFLLILGFTRLIETNAQTPNYHPSRILISFSETSDVYIELASYFNRDLNKLELNLDNKYKNNIPVTIQFMSNYNIKSINKIGGISNSNIYGNRNTINTSIKRNRIFTILTQGQDIIEIINQLNNSDHVEYAEPDYVMRGAGVKISSFSEINSSQSSINDPYFTNQWGLSNTGQQIFGVYGKSEEDINIIPVWETNTGSSDITVAIMDTGIPESAQDFQNRVLPGYDFANNDSDAIDDHGHGTSVTSIALAEGNNNNTIAGVDWNAKILPIKILNDENWGYYSWWVSGVYFAIDNNVDVINASIGGTSVSNSLKLSFEDAISKGIHVIACMMNDNNEIPAYPAAYKDVIAEGAINNKGERAAPFLWGGGSNYGEHIDLVAPGNAIASIVYNNPNNVEYWSGTSMAAPMVSGVVALMLAEYPELTPSITKELLTSSARGDGTWNKYTGWGILDAKSAMNAAKERLTSNELGNLNSISFILEQNYPNPFNPSTRIEFMIPKESLVSLKIYNTLGQEVKTILENELLMGGNHYEIFDASSQPTGIYFYQLKIGNKVLSKKMMLIK